MRTETFRDRLRKTALRFPGIHGFTLVELIVVITVLAILATVGFLSLSGYSDDARQSAIAANVRTVYSAILAESATSGNSPRWYVDHDPAAALLGGTVFVEGSWLTLTGGQFGSSGTNYSAGNPRWDRLRMNGEKFRLSAAFGNAGFGSPADRVWAAYDTDSITIGAFDVVGKATLTGKSKTVTYFQVAGISPSTKKAVVTGNYTSVGSGAVLGLVKDPRQSVLTGAVVDGTVSGTSATGTAIVGNDSTGRRWADGTNAPTCKEYRNPPSGKTYAGSIGNGTYWIDPDGSGGSGEFKAYCDMATDGGGWTLVSYAGTINGTCQATAGVSQASYQKPLFFDWGTYDPAAISTKSSFSRVRQFRPLFTEGTEYLARRTGNPDNMVVFPMPASKYGSWFGRNESEGDFTIPTDAYLPYLKMTNAGNAGWKTVTNSVYWSYDSSWYYPGINWNDGGTPGLSTTNNVDGYGSYDTGLNHRSILYWEIGGGWGGAQWFHASPLSLKASTGPGNWLQDFEFYVRN